MEYYILKKSTEKNIIGSEYPQIQTMGGTVNRDADDSLYNVYSNKFPDFIPNLNYFIVESKSILTDVLSASMISFGFIVNDKVKNIFEQHKLPPHKFYPATVQYNAKFYNNYYWFFFVSDVLNFVDYDKTSFFITDMIGEKIEDCKETKTANSLTNLKEVLPDDRDINSDLIIFKKEIIEKYDIFKIGFGDYYTFASKKIADNLINANITGFRILSTKKIQTEKSR